ncbi:hypothetical protein N3K66_002698 [Trichothecium roseum]|uniref:Uncharacterized protein n=1 Tax=Trichothecium roseum TaxID=47278 RepID=A0ACC0VAA7_9HYPO|nr:hypothetical protein N3K66_002698 [Trichothecium roseum]
MAASSRGRQVLRDARLVASPSSICSRCATSSSSSSTSNNRSFARLPPAAARLYSTPSSVTIPEPPRSAASGGSPPTPPPQAQQQQPSSSSSSAATTKTKTTTTTTTAAVAAAAAYDIRSGLILTRPPLLTRKLHPFEDAFFFYQKRLEERLNTAFIPSIYYKPDTARRIEWDLKVRERRGAVARELGAYHGKSSAAWDDELLVGDTLSAQESVVDSLLRDAAVRVSDDAEVIPAEDVRPVVLPGGRESGADAEGDVRRLDRAMDRTLYLVVKGADGAWGFPSGKITRDENLHEAAQRILDESAGVDMNTWIVGRVPVAHLVTPPPSSSSPSSSSSSSSASPSSPPPTAAGATARGQKTFFLKGRIMAGQANLAGNKLGYTDFKWLTREELEQELSPAYFKGVRNMMTDR